MRSVHLNTRACRESLTLIIFISILGVTYLNNYRINNVVERNDYYPFGGRWDDGSGRGGTIAATDNRYALSGKERQTMSRMGSYLAAHESLQMRTKNGFSCAFCVFYQHFDTKSPKTCLPDVQIVSDLGDPSRCGLKQKI